MDAKGRFMLFLFVLWVGEIRECLVVYGKDPVMAEKLKT